MPDRGTDAQLAAALGAYVLGEELGRGAAGIVVAGRHRWLQREVAVKRLPQVFASDPDLRARFLAEARALASLEHPHIVPIYDFVEADGVLALVMERLHGGSVWDRYQADGFTGPSACAAILATALALQHAHAKGVLHRDIKPQNLLFSAEGVLKVTDFGIAKVVGSTLTELTRDGDTLGTPGYMAPEQASGAALGPYTDVYGAGTVLYVLLCGHMPFPPAANALAQLYQRVHDDPVGLLERDPGAPAQLHEVTMRALARDPAARYATAIELAEAIDRAAGRQWGPDWRAQTDVVVRGAPSDVRRPARTAPSAAHHEAATVAPLEPPGPGDALHVAGPDHDLVRALEEALAAPDEYDDAVRVAFESRLAVELQLTGSVDRRDALSRAALERAGGLGDRSLELLAGYSRLVATWSPDVLEARLGAADRLLRVARALGDEDMVQRTRRLRLRALIEGGDLDEADQEIAVLAETADAGAEHRERWQARLCQAMRALHAGRAGDGERLALEAHEIGRQREEELARRYLHAQIAAHRWLAGPSRELVPALRDAHEACPWLPLREAALIFGLVELDRRTEASAQLERLAGESFDAVPYDANWLATMALLSVACARLGDERRTRLLHDALTPFADRIPVDGDCTAIGPPVAGVLGILATACGRFEEADAHFQRALDHTNACGAASQTSFLQAEHARLFLARRRPGDAERAAALLEDAAATAGAHGMAGLVARAQALQAATRTPSSRR